MAPESVPDEVEALIVVPPEEPAQLGPQGYQGAGQTRLTAEQAAALMVPFQDDEHEIKPTSFGEVYVSHVHIRKRLNMVLGPGQWTLVPVPDRDGAIYFQDKEKSICYRGRLYIHGNFISEAVGEQKMASEQMTYASACEGARSDALSRCGKDLSLAWECWSKQWTDAWRKKFAVRVAVKRKGDTKFLWRRKDANRLSGEAGTVPDEQEASSGPTITKEQQADMWALATERYTRKEAEAVMRTLLEKHGFKTTYSITTDKFKEIMNEIRSE